MAFSMELRKAEYQSVHELRKLTYLPTSIKIWLSIARPLVCTVITMWVRPLPLSEYPHNSWTLLDVMIKFYSF